jgi:hypothetical protein
VSEDPLRLVELQRQKHFSLMDSCSILLRNRASKCICPVGKQCVECQEAEEAILKIQQALNFED